LEKTCPATVLLFGKLHTLCMGRGLPATIELELPEEGKSAEEILEGLCLPAGEVEGVFINHKVHSLDHLVLPGDRIAFVPRGTPGPHRYTLGLYNAGKCKT
jgi:hypothetical protein